MIHADRFHCSKTAVSDTIPHPVGEEWALGRELTGAVAADELWFARFGDDGVACIYYYNPRNGQFMVHLWTL